jgi:hypothetical protein
MRVAGREGRLDIGDLQADRLLRRAAQHDRLAGRHDALELILPEAQRDVVQIPGRGRVGRYGRLARRDGLGLRRLGQCDHDRCRLGRRDWALGRDDRDLEQGLGHGRLDLGWLRCIGALGHRARAWRDARSCAAAPRAWRRLRASLLRACSLWP